MTNLRYYGGERELEPKHVRWIASSKNDVRELPGDVKDEVGQTLWKIQCGDTPANIDRVERRLKIAREHYEQNP